MDHNSITVEFCIRIILAFMIFGGVSKGIVTVQEYCDKFNNYNVKPLICLLRVNNNNSTTVPGWETEEEDNCTCDVNCFPRFDIVESLPDTEEEDMDRRLLDESGELQCQPCGTNCPISAFLSPRCSCAALGPSTSSSGPRCRCTVTCAGSPRQTDNPFCIFNVTRITRLRDPSRVYTCECDKSKAAMNNPYPDFACICQPNL